MLFLRMFTNFFNAWARILGREEERQRNFLLLLPHDFPAFSTPFSSKPHVFPIIFSSFPSKYPERLQ